MKTASNIKNILAFMLLTIVASACKDINTDKLSCLYCGIAIPDHKKISIILNSSLRGGPDDTTRRIAEKEISLRIGGTLNCELCSMKCYSNFKSTFYQQNSDSIFYHYDTYRKGVRIDVWILNEKRKSIQYDGQNDLKEQEPVEVGSGN